MDAAEPITELDLYVGAVITIHQRTFELLEADEFTMQASSAVQRCGNLAPCVDRCAVMTYQCRGVNLNMS